MGCFGFLCFKKYEYAPIINVKMGQSEGMEAKTIQKCYDLNGMYWAIVSQIVGESLVQIIFSNCYGKYIYHYIYKLNHNISLLS